MEQGVKEGEDVILNPLEFMEQSELASADEYRGLGDTSDYTDSDSVDEEPVTDE